MNTVFSAHSLKEYMRIDMEVKFTSYKSGTMQDVHDLHIDQGYDRLQICMNIDQLYSLYVAITKYLDSLNGEETDEAKRSDRAGSTDSNDGEGVCAGEL